MLFVIERVTSKRLRVFLSCTMAGWLWTAEGLGSSQASEAVEAPKELEGFFSSHCYGCHDEDVQKGGLNLVELSRDLSNPETYARWVRLYDRVAGGEMPPEKKPQPSGQELGSFRGSLAPQLARVHEAEKGTILRRLNREEYENTINDLFGTNLKLASQLPEDGRSHEFSNVGNALGISMAQMQKYLDSIDQVMESAIATWPEPPEKILRRVSYAETREGKQFIGKHWGQAEDGAVVFFRRTGYPSGLLRGSGVEISGKYKIRVTGYAYRSDTPVTFHLQAVNWSRGAEQPTPGYFSLPPGKPTTVEVETWIPRGYMVSVAPEGLYDPENSIRKNGIAQYTGPGLAINHVEVEGPLLDEFPSRGHHLVVGELNQEVQGHAKHHKASYSAQDPQRAGRVTLERIAPLVFRRPLEPGELEPFLALLEAELAEGEPVDQAVRTGIAALLCSPQFLYLQEKPGELDDYAIASRLSYFLTRTAPDPALLRAAGAGRLSGDGDELASEVNRLLDGEHLGRWVEDFSNAWLDLRDIEFTAPDRVLFPEFDPFLQYSMLEETRGFLRLLIEENLPIRNIVKSDFAMLNNRLARHYGVDGVEGPEVRPVSLPEGSVRGGILSQGSVLKVTANGTNTSPVLRGVWVLERILGKHPAPPPPGIPGVEPDIRGAETLRQMLDKHRDSTSCQGCHRLIDPPGFALESFNPIGGWRDRYRTLDPKAEKVMLHVGNGAARYRVGAEVDASGELPNGGEFSGFVEFRDKLAGDEDRLAKAFIKKLLIFATGREIGFSDRPEINRLVQASKKRGHGVRDMIHLVVQSQIFQNK